MSHSFTNETRRDAIKEAEAAIKRLNSMLSEQPEATPAARLEIEKLITTHIQLIKEMTHATDFRPPNQEVKKRPKVKPLKAQKIKPENSTF